MGIFRREQIAGMNIHYRNYSFDYFLDSQAKAGFLTVELWGGAPHFWLDHNSFSDCRVIRKKAADRGLKIVVFTPENCIYQYQIGAKEEDIRKKSFDYFTNGIRAAAELECGIMEITSGWGYFNEDLQTSWKRSADMLGKLAEVAAGEGIQLAMETLRPEESQLVTTIRTARKMMNEVKHSALKVMIDTIAMGVSSETIQQWFTEFGKDIIHMHFVDGDPYGHLIWGDGSYPLGDFIQTLKKNHYNGFLGQEITDERYFLDPYSHDLRNMRNFERYL